VFRNYRFWLGAAVVWMLLAAICLIELWPDWPKTWQQWALLAVAGPPIYVFLELLGEKASAPTSGPVPSNSDVSLKRILFLLLRCAAFLAVVWIAFAIGRSLFNR
jgi:hypothetical protein